MISLAPPRGNTWIFLATLVPSTEKHANRLLCPWYSKSISQIRLKSLLVDRLAHSYSRPPFVDTNQLSMVPEITVLVLICSMTGRLDKYFFKKGCNFCGIVAEDRKLKLLGRPDAICLPSSKAHIESHIRLSSTTKV